jgi:hypothetical protein
MAKGAKTVAMEVGTKVSFLGYSEVEDMEEDEFVLEEGQVGTIAEVDEENRSYAVEIPNPDFDDSKRKSKANPLNIRADAFFEEVEESDEPDESEEEEAPAKKAAPKKKAAAKKKAAPKKKAAVKKKATAKKKAAAEVEDEDEDEDEADHLDVDGRIALHDEDPEILGLVEGVSDEELLELAQEVVEESSNADYRVAGVLYHVRNTGAYKGIDPEYAATGGFEAYINEVLGMEYRKAMYLIDIYYKFSKFEVSSELIATEGWTKCSQIARVMTEDNADALVEAAETLTVADLKETIKEDFTIEDGKAKAPTKKRVTFKFRLYEDQAGGVEQIMEEAMETLSLDMNQAFEHMATEWASEHLNVRAQQKRKAAPKKKATAKKAPAKKAAAKKAPARGGKAPAKKAAPKKKAASRKKATRR